MILFAVLCVLVYVFSSKPFLALDYLSKTTSTTTLSLLLQMDDNTLIRICFYSVFSCGIRKFTKKYYSRIYSVSTNFTLARTHAKHTHHYLSGIEKWVSYILHRRSTAALIRVNFTLYAEGQIFYIFWGVSNGMKKLMYSPQTKKNN